MKQGPAIDFNIVQSILDFLPMGVYVLNRERKVQWVNRRIIHRLQKENVSQYPEKYCYKEIFKRKTPCDDCPALKTFETGLMEHTEIKSDYRGEMRHYLITTSPLRKGQKEKEAFIIETVQDITYQKKADEELRRLNDFNAAIINNAPVAIFTIDKTGEFMSVNPALATISGLGTEAEGKLLGFNWIENPYTIRCGLAEHIKKGLTGEPFELVDFPFITYRGDRGQYVNLRGVPLKGKDGKVEGLLCIIEDSTEKVTAQIQSIQDAKMSVIGRLMTGVAHELNNPLATIAANSELACELFQGFKDGHVDREGMKELHEYLDVVQEQAFRCKNIIKDMIDLTRKKGFEVQDINLKECLKEILPLINFKKANILLVRDIADDVPYVRGDLNAMKQCLMNILHNAVDALETREGGIVRLVVGHVDKNVKIEIEDNGVGIHDSMLDKIFEPFFSTKDTGKGVGLGLTLCYEFLNRMGGNIEVESTLGKGSLFKITLPAHSKEKKVTNNR
jgi:PAS domain S-box-containing protein